MQVNFECQLQKLGQEQYEHNRRTGALIRQLLEISGRGDLVAFWRLEEQGPCDYHDLGKRAGDLDPLSHCGRGAAIFTNAYAQALDGKERVFCSIASDLCQYHHERWDGSGGLGHLAGEDIPVVARAGAVADAWDHLIQEHPGVAPQILFEYMEKHSGTWYDPQMVAALRQWIPSFIPGMPEE